MKLIRIFCISVFVLLSSITVSFANSGEINDNEKIQESKNLQENINNYILDIYKLQWNKIIAELDNNLEKMNINKEWKKEVYSNIQETLKLRKKSVESDKNTGKNAKIILINYLDHMINEFENKKKNP